MSADKQPDYVAALRLNCAPYETDTGEAFFFADPPLSRWLDQLQQLTQVGGRVLVIEGDAGSGKTALLRQLITRVSGGRTVCCVQGADLAEPTVVLRQLARQFALDETAHPDDLRRLIAEYCRGTAQTSQAPILLIDDAGRVPRPVLEQVLSLCGSPAETVESLRVLLFGLPGLRDELVTAGFARSDPSLIHALVVQPLDEAQTDAYLLHRLGVAGYSGASPFSRMDVRAIHESAAGLPGRINQLAHQTLLQHAWLMLPRGGRCGGESAGGRPLRFRGFSRGRWWLGAGLATVVLAAMFWWPGVSQRRGDQPPAGIVTHEATLSRADTVSAQTGGMDSGRMSLSSPAAPVSVTPPVATVGGHEAGDAKQRPVDDRPAPALKTQPAGGEAGVYRENWLRSQPPDAVTLQLVAVSQESSVHRFLKQAQLPGPTAYFHMLRNKKDLYVVVYEVYPNLAAAKAAIPALPQAIRQGGGPWPRTFASIQRDIQSGAAP
jgi:MSHA biogenesis protein MshM